MTQFINSFNNIDNIDNIDNPFDNSGFGLYEPSWTDLRKPESHTMRKTVVHVPHEYTVEITRPECSDGIPVTEMDQYLNDRAFHRYTYGGPIMIALHKKDLYERFIFEIEENCVEKTTVYDKQNNVNKTKYKVPAHGLLVDHIETPRSDISQQKVETVEDIQKFIMIRGKMYPVYNYFREVGLEYGKIQLPKNYFSTQSLCEDDETGYCVNKTSFSKDVITYSFHHDMKISSIVLQPELMKFKQVAGDGKFSRYDRQNPLVLRKQKHYINVLENDPGYLSKFELSYRSELTNGQWVKHGIFNGNVSITDFTKISFDEIQAKEIRITPLSFHKSFEHIRITFIGKCEVKPKSEQIFVTYAVSVPRDGKYMKKYTKSCDSNAYRSFDSEFREWTKFSQLKKQRNKKRELNYEMRQKGDYDA